MIAIFFCAKIYAFNILHGVFDMIVEQIDLYKYFKLPRPEGGRGYLTVYAITNSPELDLKRRRPAMLVIPGGAYAFVSDREAEPVALAYTAHGFCTFVLNYSIAPACIFPHSLREAAMAMIFIRENAKKYCVDVDSVAAVGFSAGGHLCGCLGTLYNCEELSDLPNGDLIRPSAVILSYPVSVSFDPSVSHMGSFNNLTNNNPELTARLSLEKCVNSFSSPAFIWHTEEDNCVPVEGSLYLALAYKKNKVPFCLHIFEKGQHGISIATDEVNTPNYCAKQWVSLSVDWLKDRGFKIFS